MTCAVPAPQPDDVPALTVRTSEIDDPGVALVDLIARADGVGWSRRGEGVVGWGRAASLDVSGADRFTRASSWWQQLTRRAVVRNPVDRRGTGLVAAGSFAFSDEDYAAGTPGRSVLIVPEVLVGHRDDRWWITTVGVDSMPAPAPLLSATTTGSPGAVRFADGALSSAQWEGVVAEAVRRITATGSSPDTRDRLDKVVLARDLDVRTADPIDPRRLASRLAELYPSCYTYAVDGLVGATPELLVRLEDRLATSRVLAGTIRRTGSRQRDEALAGSLARSSKDLEEHEYAAASVAEALAPHCTALNVPESPFVLHLPNLMHLATEVTGVVDDGSSSLDLAAALHPTAAVCGTPREAAAALIAEIEGMDRARYAGPVGWMDASGDGEWGIALRGGHLDADDPRRIRLFAGCGIVAGSQPAQELAESIVKFVPMRDALSG